MLSPCPARYCAHLIHHFRIRALGNGNLILARIFINPQSLTLRLQSITDAYIRMCSAAHTCIEINIFEPVCQWPMEWKPRCWIFSHIYRGLFTPRKECECVRGVFWVQTVQQWESRKE